MKREWKPGDVAMVTVDGKERRCVRSADGRKWVVEPRSLPMPRVAEDARPLVVIDPEDREQIERLTQTYLRNYDGVDTMAQVGEVNSMQAALREFANPKPSEPLGLGAVVEDETGERWVRTAWLGDGGPWESRTGRAATFADITAVRVLSEGVQS